MAQISGSSASARSFSKMLLDQHDSTVDAVAESESSQLPECHMMEPQVDFLVQDLFYLTVQYVPLRGQPHLLFQKYLKVMKPEPEKPPPPEQVTIPVDRLVTTIDMKIYRSSNHELVGSLSRCVELPDALPRLHLPGFIRSVETAGTSSVFTLSNVITEKLVQEANAAVAGIPGFHSVFFGIYRVRQGGKFHLVSRRVQPISNSEVADFFAQGLISTDHRAEAWLEPNRLQLTFSAPPLAKRRDSLWHSRDCRR